MSSIGASQRIQSVEALRGLAALAVTWFHLTNGHTSWVKETGSLGWLGVEVFFVISGFVIPLSISRGHKKYKITRFPKFLAKRLVRLEPPYLLSILLVVILWEVSAKVPGFAGGSPDWSLEQVLLHFLYLIPLTEEEWLQPVYWTLAYEFAFYIFAGLAFGLIASSRFAYFVLTTAVLALGLWSLPPLFTLFLIGMAVYRSVEKDDSFTFTMLIIAICAGQMWFLEMELEASVGVATGLLIILTRSLTLHSAIGSVFLWLGTMSYSLYLLHVPIGGRVVNLGRRFAPENAVGEMAISLLAVVVSLIAAWAFYRIVEVPAISASRKV